MTAVPLVFAHKPGDDQQPRLPGQRLADDRAFTGLWEILGRSAEPCEPTINPALRSAGSVRGDGIVTDAGGLATAWGGSRR